jgi:hypothetical protein
MRSIAGRERKPCPLGCEVPERRESLAHTTRLIGGAAAAGSELRSQHE